ncbi:MAG: putative ABC transporter permease [Lachnospiraceae bacterium]|nr:putative ABC transporter permease [Lachnospiraceae bacterium]
MPIVFAGMDWASLTLAMAFYGVIGWLFESTIFSLCEQGKFMDRGMFICPWCPIYSVVMVVCTELFWGIERWWVVILLAGTVTSLFELIASILMELVFGKRFWDYSYYPLNLDGRISVVAGCFFGIAIWMATRFLQPMVAHLLLMIPDQKRVIAAIIAWAIFWLDIGWVAVYRFKLNKTLCKAYEDVIAWKMSIFDWCNVKKDIFSNLLVVRAAKKGLEAGSKINHGLVSAQEHTNEFVKERAEHVKERTEYVKEQTSEFVKEHIRKE